MGTAEDIIATAVRERVRRDGSDLSESPGLARRYVAEEIRRYAERGLAGSAPLVADEQATARAVVASLTGLGPLQGFLDDPTVEEIWINAPEQSS